MTYLHAMRRTYRTRTYIAADWDHDRDAVCQLHKWNDSNYWSLSFTDAHELQQSEDTSLPCTIKRSLKDRMDHSKQFVLIVGDHTTALTKGCCFLCDSYNSHGHYCVRKYSVDNCSYIDFECDKAIDANIDIVVLYKSLFADRNKCPAAVRHKGKHVPMIASYSRNGEPVWDYQAVKMALGE